jgi:hypothetical protein
VRLPAARCRRREHTLEELREGHDPGPAGRPCRGGAILAVAVAFLVPLAAVAVAVARAAHIDPARIDPAHIAPACIVFGAASIAVFRATALGVLRKLRMRLPNGHVERRCVVGRLLGTEGQRQGRQYG